MSTFKQSLKQNKKRIVIAHSEFQRVVIEANRDIEIIVPL